MVGLRLWHAYLGILTGPCILFFALTGAVQLFDLHEPHGGYEPPSVIAKLGMLHKKQVYAEPRRRPRPANADVDGPPRQRTDGSDRASLGTTVLRWVFLVVALGLAGTAGLGIWIGLQAPRYKRVAWVLLAAGIAIPVALLSLAA